jgi:hypothetical protein
VGTTNSDVLDAALNVIKTTCNKMVVCSQNPTTYTEANATYAVADVAMTTGDFTIDAGDSGGRKVTVAAKSAVDIDTTESDTTVYVALLDTALSKLLHVTTGSSVGILTQGNTVNFPAWKITLIDS